MNDEGRAEEGSGSPRPLIVFVMAGVCGIIGDARLTVTLGVQLYLILFQETGRWRRSRDGIAGK